MFCRVFILLFVSLFCSPLQAGIKVVSANLYSYAHADGPFDSHRTDSFPTAPATFRADALGRAGSSASASLVVTDAFLNGSELRLAFDSSTDGAHVQPDGWIGGSAGFSLVIELTTPALLQYSVHGSRTLGGTSEIEFGPRTGLLFFGDFNEFGSKLLQPGSYEIIATAGWNIEPRVDFFTHSSAALTGSFQLSAMSSTVPEPNSLAIFALGGCTLLFSRRSKRHS